MHGSTTDVYENEINFPQSDDTSQPFLTGGTVFSDAPYGSNNEWSHKAGSQAKFGSLPNVFPVLLDGWITWPPSTPRFQLPDIPIDNREVTS